LTLCTRRDDDVTRAIVTGGGTGIGRACAKRLASDGFEVVIVGRRIEVLTDAAAAINECVGEVRVVAEPCDLEEPAAVGSLAERLSDGPSVDVLVNNAGGVSLEEADTLEEVAAGWRRDFDNNVMTTVLITEALLPQMTRPGGRIVVMSSVAAFRGAGSYGAAKAAINAWMYGMSARLASDGITVNAVAPGFVPDTEFWDSRRSHELIASRSANIPMGRPGTPDEVAESVAYLASPGSGWTTGTILHVNGGDVLGR
jgi:3-oxoacyl-[acyl-carrier protein] reductase